MALRELLELLEPLALEFLLVVQWALF